jgi:subtilisin family serine protease
MQKRIFLLSLVFAICLLSLLIEAIPIWNPSSSAAPQDRVDAVEVAAAIQEQQRDAANMTRSVLADQKFRDLDRKTRLDGTVSVIVKLRVAFRPEGGMRRGSEIRAQRELINQTRDSLVKRLNRHNPRSLKRFDSVPYVAVKVNTEGLEALRLSSDVIDIHEDEIVSLTLAESTPLVGAQAAWSNGFTGIGKTVAILDTGMDKTHSFLSGKVVSEACFSTNNPTSGVSSLCPGGVTDSTSVDSGVNCTGLAGCDHGTHVAGIAAGRGSSFSGVARDANLISIQVFSRFDNSSDCGGTGPCIRSFTSDLMKGLERVYALRNTYSIASVNMSLGGGRFTSNCDTNPLKGVIDQLRSAGIATVIASGNGGFSDAISSPACISSAVSVGATGDGGRISGNSIASYSNSAPFLNLLAPGDFITSSVPGGGFAIFSGTSMATPHVAGAWAALSQKFPTASVTEILNLLTNTGVKLSDPRNGVILPRIFIDRPAGCVANVPADRWKGEYYNNTTLSGFPSVMRDEGGGFLNLNFGTGSPSSGCGMGMDFFSARWTRTVNFAAGAYRFTASVDNGVRLYVDGQLKIDKLSDLSPNTYTADVVLSAGDHEIRLEFVEFSGGASVNLSWAAVSGATCLASVPADRWRGEYYNNTTLTGGSVLMRDDGGGFLNLNFGDGSPSSACGLGVDNFSARWTRTVNFAAGVYRFAAFVDNGARLYVDGQLKIDKFSDLPPNTYTADVPLAAGNHEIRLEFVEFSGGASVNLSWAAVSGATCLASVPADQWRGEYYNNSALTGAPAMVRNDGAGFLNFDFGFGGPSSACGLGVDNFSARWTRTVNFTSGGYRFTVTGDDGIRLYVDGLLWIDKWFDQAPTTYTADVFLSAGNHDIKLEFYENGTGGTAVAFLSWAKIFGP